MNECPTEFAIDVSVTLAQEAWRMVVEYIRYVVADQARGEELQRAYANAAK